MYFLNKTFRNKYIITEKKEMGQTEDQVALKRKVMNWETDPDDLMWCVL